MRMKSALQLLASLALCVVPACAKPTIHLALIRQPATTFTIGPGTVISIRALDMPFVGMHYAIQYRSDDGELIELWNSGRNLLLVKGMHGMLTYSTNPERILQFRVLPPAPQEMPVERHVTAPADPDGPIR